MARLLTVSHVAEILGVSEQTIRNWSDSGELPHIRLPKGHRRYNTAHVLDFARRIGILSDSAGLACGPDPDKPEGER